MGRHYRLKYGPYSWTILDVPLGHYGGPLLAGHTATTIPDLREDLPYVTHCIIITVTQLNNAVLGWFPGLFRTWQLLKPDYY